ncbi:MAG: hypothetical protein K9G67_10205 [Bacteroidales bacterium]|nr:hypothetical protein [Bacteroidales bacterium]MCF8345312.1 hypothetical protein [Bacteroidales bacterium]MCF8349974.1 hypothetical protein [Bacteroidales bacterium]MCF8376716.1 hypothetical protein [Bacteroidales bacterium]
MIAIADQRIPDEAKTELGKFSNCVFLKTENIVYESISGHPDIFFCKIMDRLIVAPNLPEYFKKALQKHHIDFIEGEMPVGARYPGTALYNAVFSDDLLIHNFRYTDSGITEFAADAELIHVNQGYARCNIAPLGNKKFITSDEGIHKTILRYGLDVLCVTPDEIILPGQKHGFIGGCCGVEENKLFVTGSLHHFSEGDKIRKFVSEAGFQIIELYDGPLFDGGGLLFV